MAGGLGFLLGAFYDVFRVIRLLMRPSAKVVFFQDLLFFALSSVVTFLFALAVTGGSCVSICSWASLQALWPIILPSAGRWCAAPRASSPRFCGCGTASGRRFFSRSAFFGNFYAVPSPPWLDFL